MSNVKSINPGIGHILEVRKLKERITEHEATIARLTQENNALLSGIVLKGWWCIATPNVIPCETFNGAEKEQLTHCRRCGSKRPNSNT